MGNLLSDEEYGDDRLTKVENTEENRRLCLCPMCPSMPKGCGGEALYCAMGGSRCDIDIQGCVCAACVVYGEHRLEGLYFCDREAGGSGIEMRKRRTTEDPAFYRRIFETKLMASAGRSILSSMGSQKVMPFSFDDLHLVPAQVAVMPRNAEEPVETRVVIGPKARRPLEVSTPILIAGLSYGAVSRGVKRVVARSARRIGTGYCSGEGGILAEDLDQAPRHLIVQYSTARFGITDDVLASAAAIEIRFGQGAYPGKGSYLPPEKITPEIATMRGLKPGEAAYSPARHPDIATPKEIQARTEHLRTVSGGVPIGAKIGCGNVEKDVRVLVDAGVDYIAIDGFGGGTGATMPYVRDNVGIPLVAALPRAARFLARMDAEDRVTLIASGGLRTSADIAKCLALGADAVYLGTAVMIAMNCDQYRICETGLCPRGVTTQDEQLARELSEDRSVERVCRFITTLTDEVENLTRIVGKHAIQDLVPTDLVALDRDLAGIAGCPWLDGRI